MLSLLYGRWFELLFLTMSVKSLQPEVGVLRVKDIVVKETNAIPDDALEALARCLPLGSVLTSRAWRAWLHSMNGSRGRTPNNRQNNRLTDWQADGGGVGREHSRPPQNNSLAEFLLTLSTETNLRKTKIQKANILGCSPPSNIKAAPCL
jgi:hypothetical protein